MNILFGLFLAVVLVSNLYITNFQSTADGKDERGILIQYQITRVMYRILYIGTVSLFLLHLVDVLTASQTVNLLFILILFTSVPGAIWLYYKKK